MTRAHNQLGTPVLDLQSMLRAISDANTNILPVIPDGIYGPNTYASVQSFQSFFGLPPTGIADYRTWSKIVSEYEAGLHNIPLRQIAYKPTPTKPELSIIQAKLAHLESIYLSGNTIHPTGEYDEATIALMKWIQSLSNLDENGYADIHTQYALDGLFQNSIID